MIRPTYRHVDYRRPETPHARLIPVKGGIGLESAYSPALVADLRALPAEDRRWDPAAKLWVIHPRHAQRIVLMCKRHLGIDVTVPAVEAAKPETRILEIHYIGRCKQRASGESLAYGWHNGGWNCVLSEQVLRRWFEGDLLIEQKPGEQPTLYATLAVKPGATEDEVRRAYRKMVKIWHPDRNPDVDAATQFRAIQHAYEVLSDPVKSRKYSAGLALAATVKIPPSRMYQYHELHDGYRCPLMCGYILAEVEDALGRLIVRQILLWEDIVNADGRVMSASYPMGADKPEIRWVEA